jgi:predicted O-linked N-acetylglucosamine transferase (SPINDLY family)
MAAALESIHQALQYLQAGHLSQAEETCRQLLQINASNPDAWYFLGIACQLQAKIDDAGAAYDQALRLRPDYAEAYSNLGALYLDQGRWREAEHCCRQALRFQPNRAEAHNNLGAALEKQGKNEEAAACFEQAARLQPHSPEIHYNLAGQRRKQGRMDEAVASYRRALELRPDYLDALNNLGVLLSKRGAPDEAVICFQQALVLNPMAPDVYNNLGDALDLQGKPDEAIACFRRALELQPDYANALNNLGLALSSTNKLDEAATCLRRVLSLDPSRADAHNNLGNVCVEQGLLADAVTCYQRALDCQADFAGAESNLLVARNYHPEVDTETLYEEHLQWAARHASPTAVAAHPNNRDPGRRLRIGYVSPDFRRHAVAYFVEPIVTHYDRGQFEVYCYAEAVADDEVSARFRAGVGHWRPTRGRTDREVAQQIRADGIDILVDLAGHTSHGRLTIFALKPAPVQISYLGYPNTTGLSTIDYRLTDAVADPAGEPTRHSERLIRLPRAFCYCPPAAAPPASSSPAAALGHVTFGSFHNLAKLNDNVLDLWCEVLRMVPSARLRLFRHTLTGSTKEHFHCQLTNRGISPERFDLNGVEARLGHLRDYTSVDITLDAFPWNGHTTACESLWMGVPVLTLYGNRYAGRMAASALTALGLTELIARSPQEYLALAARWASDVDRLARLRTELRERMRRSPLCDGGSFTRDLEKTYRQVWVNWCAT